MQNGIQSLGDFAVTGADTYVGDWVDGFDGVTELDAQIRFAYGSGGATIKVFIQGSMDQGTTAYDLWCFTATTASKTRARWLKRDGTELTPTDGTLPDDTIAAGIVLGDRFRAKIVSTGTYAGSTVLSVRVHPR